MSEYYDLPYTGAEVASDLAKVNDKESLVGDAPSDGTSYARSGGEWSESSVGQLSTALDAINGDAVGDGLSAKLISIVESKAGIKQALIDAGAEDVGGVLRTYADKINAIVESRWQDITLAQSLFDTEVALETLSYMRVNGSPLYLCHYGNSYSKPCKVKKIEHIKIYYKTALNAFRNCTSLVNVSDISLPSATSADYMFCSCTSLVNVSDISLPSATSADYMFGSCTSLVNVPDISLPSVTSADSMFRNCTSLVNVPDISLPSATSADYMFYGCNALVNVSDISLPSATSAGYMFGDCTALVKINSLNIPKASVGLNTDTLRFFVVKNIGESHSTPVSFSSIPNWGIEDETIPLSAGARQSLIDSLITFSYDRAAAGMTACTITLSATTKALLTDEEIAQITAKGFTLS